MMTAVKMTIAITLWIIGYTVYAQGTCQATFTGTIKTAAGDVLPGASILLTPTHAGTISNADGQFVVHDLCPGTYQVLVQYIGYKSQQFTITLPMRKARIITLAEEVTELGEVVVEDKLENTEGAQNMTVLTEKDLEQTAGKSLGESLREVAGVSSIQAGPGIFKPVIHGVHSQRVLILNHGIRQEGQQWGAEHAPEIDPFIASNIVVIKDASAIKYGNDALGGVVVVNPAPLPDAPGLGGTVQTVLQSNGRSGTLSGVLEGGIGKLKGWGWRAQGTVKQAGDYHAPDYMLTNTGVREKDFSLATGYHRNNTGFEVFFSHFRTTLGILKGTSISNIEDLENAMEREPPQYTKDNFSYHIEAPRQEVGHNLLKLSAHKDVAGGTLRFQYGFQHNARKEYNVRTTEYLTGIPTIDLTLNTHTVQTDWEKKGRKFTTSLGISGMYQKNSNIPGTQTIPFIPNFNNTAAGIFGVLKFKVNGWDVDGGMRYDFRHYNVAGYDYKNSLYHDDMNFQNISATAGASKQLTHTQKVSLNLSTAWRPPHVSELFSFGTHQSVAANEYGLLISKTSSEVVKFDEANIPSEQALKFVSTYELNAGKFNGEVTGYANYIFNYIYLRPDGITETITGPRPAMYYTQTDALFVGGDVAMTYQLTPQWQLASKSSLLWASDQTNHDYLINIPANRYELSVQFEQPDKFALKGFYIKSTVRYTDKQHRAPRTITVSELEEAKDEGVDLFENNNSNFDFMDAPAGYWMWNLSAGCALNNDGRVRYHVRMSAENLLNTSYRDYSNRFRYYSDDIGRNFILSLKCVF